MNLFVFFKIESWNFQHLFKIEFREISQNFNSFSLFRQFLFSFFLLVVWLSWNFVRFNEIQMLKVSAFYLEKQNSFIPKKNIFWAVADIKTKKLCLLTQFSRTVLDMPKYQLILTPPDFQTFRCPCCRVPFRCFKARLCLGLQILCQIRACAQAFKSWETCKGQ